MGGDAPEWPAFSGRCHRVRNRKVYRVVPAQDRGPLAEVMAAEMPLLVAISQRVVYGLSLRGLSATAPEPNAEGNA